MANVSGKYDIGRESLIAVNFIEDPSIGGLMRLTPDGVLYVKGQFIEETKSYDGNSVKMSLTSDGNLYAAGFIEESKSAAPTGAVSPSDYPLTVWWRAEDLTGFSEGDQITIDTSSWFSHDNTYSASQASGLGDPYYTENVFLNNKASVHFDSSTNDTLLMSSLFHLTGSTISVLIKDDGTDGMILGNSTANKQIRRWRSSANNISAYWGISDIPSANFSSSAGQVVVLTWVFGNSDVDFYENKYTRKSGNLSTSAGTFNWIGRTSYGQALSGSIAEICIWGQQLSTSSLESLFDNYWKVKYSGETFYEA